MIEKIRAYCDENQVLLPDMELAKYIIREAKKEVFDVFDRYACVKNDKWYLELKERHLKKKSR